MICHLFVHSITPFSSDKRGMFYSNGQNLEIESIPPFEEEFYVRQLHFLLNHLDSQLLKFNRIY